MYPRNATSPEPVAIGPVVQIADGAVQTSGVTVRIKPVGVAEADGAGTTAYSTDGVVIYTPTQSETNYTSFVLIAKKTGCLPASQTVITSDSTVSGRVYVGTNGDKTNYSLSTGGVTGVTDGVWNAALSSYTVNGSFGARIMRTDSASAGNGAKVTGAGHVAADIHELQPAVIDNTHFAAGAIDANALAADAVAEFQSGLATLSNQTTILARLGAFTGTGLNTVLGFLRAMASKVASTPSDIGGTFTANTDSLEAIRDASAAGGGSATLENQELILDEIDSLRSAFATAVGRLAVASQIVGFPTVLVRNSDYSTVTESEIRLSLNDLDGNPITEIGGVACASIDWLFGIGSERAPQLIEGAATWDAGTNQLVIQVDAEDTSTTPLGSLSWQIGCTIGTTTRFLGGGTTRLIERQF